MYPLKNQYARRTPCIPFPLTYLCFCSPNGCIVKMASTWTNPIYYSSIISNPHPHSTPLVRNNKPYHLFKICYTNMTVGMYVCVSVYFFLHILRVGFRLRPLNHAITTNRKHTHVKMLVCCIHMYLATREDFSLKYISHSVSQDNKHHSHPPFQSGRE